MKQEKGARISKHKVQLVAISEGHLRCVSGDILVLGLGGVFTGAHYIIK